MILAFLLAFGGTAGFAQTRVSGPALRVLDVDVPTVTARAEERSTLEVRVPVEIADAPSADWARLVLEYDSSAIEYRGAELTAEAIEQGWMPSARDGFREVSEGRLEGSFLRVISGRRTYATTLIELRFLVHLGPHGGASHQPYAAHAIRVIDDPGGNGSAIGYLPSDRDEKLATPIASHLSSGRIFVHEASWVEIGSGEMTRRDQVFSLPLYVTVLDPVDMVSVGIDYDELILREVRIVRPGIREHSVSEPIGESESLRVHLRFADSPKPRYRAHVADLVFEYRADEASTGGALVIVPSLADTSTDGAGQVLASTSIPGLVIFSEPRFVRGNVDSEKDDGGRPDLDDAIRILRALYVPETPDLGCREAADVNDDGSVTVSDAVHLLNYLFHGRRAPAVPFPAAGPDPVDSPNHLGCERPLPWFAPVIPEHEASR